MSVTICGGVCSSTFGPSLLKELIAFRAQVVELSRPVEGQTLPTQSGFAKVGGVRVLIHI